MVSPKCRQAMKALALILFFLLLSPAGFPQSALAASPAVADPSQMTTVEEVGEAWMEPVYAENLVEGEYPVEVESSSSMFRIERAVLHVEDDRMEAELTMGGQAYLYVFPGSAEEAAESEESAYIPYTENADGKHVFTIPVEALDEPFPCAAYSKNKELWYNRSLLLRTDSLPMEAFREGFFVTAESLALEDGNYTAEVTLAGGSGKASVVTPLDLTVKDGLCEAQVIWSSKNYDYMKIGGEKFFPEEGFDTSAFRIPVRFFDRPMQVIADTVAMSTPHEISYALRFDSESLEKAAE